MFRSLLLAACVAVGVSASAKTATITDLMINANNQVLKNVVTQGLNLKKGDEADYKMKVAIIDGSMKMLVMDVVAEGVWIQQLLDLGFAGKQDIQELLDPNTGEIKKMIVNGKEQTPPAKGDIEVIDTKEEKITVPAGSFDCVYIHAKVKNNEQASEVEQWVNMHDIPVFGMAKMTAQTQFGPMTTELTSFKRMP